MKHAVTEKCWMALFAVIPFVYAGRVYEGATLPKLLFFQIGLAVICALCAVCLPSIPKAALWWPLGCYGLLHAASIVQSANPTETVLQLSHQIGFLLVPLLVAATLDRVRISRVITAASWAGFPIALIGLAQFLGWGFESIPSNAAPSATFYHRNAAAAYIAVIIPLGVVGFRLAQTPRSAIAWAVLLTAQGIFLICTRTRAAWMAVVAAGIAIAALAVFIGATSPSPHWRIKRALIGVMGLCILLAAFLPEQIQGTRKQRFDEKKSDAVTAVSSILSAHGDRGRFDMWRRTLALIADHPLGVGLGNWQFVYPVYARGVHVNVNASPERPHNDLLWITAELGWVGLAAFAILLLTVARSAPPLLRDPQTRVLALGLCAVIIAYLIDGLFSFPRAQIMPTLGFWFAIGSIVRLNAVDVSNDSKSQRLPFVLATLLLLLAATISVQRIQYDIHHLRVHAAERAQNWETVIREAERAASYGPQRANTFIALGRARYHTGDLSRALRAYDTALRLHPNSLNAHNNQGIALRRSGRLKEAEAAFEKAIFLLPGFPEAHYNLGLVYLDQQRWQDAVSMFKKVRGLSLHTPHLFFNLGRAHYALGEMLKAQTCFLQALDQNPDFEPARAALAKLGAAYTPTANDPTP